MVCVISVVLKFSLHVSHCRGSKAQEHNMDTSSSEYETLSVESGVLSAIGEEEEFSRVRMHGKNQDLLAEVLE